ncbi:hypothetical protein QFZ63_006726 [Streptomyces sp. B3I7]|uniref:DUF5133 domain-containing protein n=1 Tax=Streptomyces sp. B3I7 TaxID=3042269 RepID=UPI0027821B12|nr:DUF5133 domain-containing protein [Streptomyces sp. B3I7]MDQ0815012.1 hypothetical protein [Streptomyces sp. B3I7]
MLMPHPATLHKLLEEYQALAAQEAADGVTKSGQRVQDLAYTLCVSTGTRDVQQALDYARRYLAAAGEQVVPTVVPLHGRPGVRRDAARTVREPAGGVGS